MSLITTTAAAAFLGFQATAASFLLFQCPGAVSTGAVAINNSGEVAGSCGTSAGSSGFIRDAKGRFTLFQVAGATYTAVKAMSKSGAIAGDFQSGGQAGGFLRTPDGAITTFHLSNPSFSVLGVNDSDQIVGSVPSGGAPQALLREPDGTWVYIVGPPNTGPYKGGVPTGINNAGEITGAGYLPFSDDGNAFLANSQVVTTTPFPFVSSVIRVGPLTPDTWGLAINDAGTIVGYANNVNSGVIPSLRVTQGFIQTATGAPVTFPVPFTANDGNLPFGPLIRAGVNIHNAAVMGFNLPGAVGSLYRSPHGKLTTIELGTCLNPMAQGINDSGWVVGSCMVDGQSYGFLWKKSKKESK